MGRAIDARPWRPQDLIDDLQALIDEEQDKYLNDRHTTLCMARDYLKAYFSLPQLSNEALTQADLDSMDYDKVWIDYEDGAGEWALVCNGYIYSIDTLEGAGLDFVDYMRGERLEPHGYKVYRRPPEGEA